MKIKISEATSLSNSVLQKWGFSPEESQLITEHFIDAELVGKNTHGIGRLLWIKMKMDQGVLKPIKEEIKIVKETAVSLLIDGRNKIGFIVINKALELGIRKVQTSGMVAVGLTNTAPGSGMIGYYARKATEQDLIFIGFNNSSGGLIPYGAKIDLWGTNPLTVGIPTKNLPIILDMASTKTTWGELLLAKEMGKRIPENIALDEEGNPTTDPEKALKGGVLPIAGHKGSGLGFIVEILAGALTKSRVGYTIPGGWGSFFILIDPTLFRDLNEFKDDIEKAIQELKNAPKKEGFDEIYYPGEKSQKLRKQRLEKGEIEVNEIILKKIRSNIS